MTLTGPICDCGHSPLSHIHAYAPRLSMCKVSGCRCNALSYALGRSTPDTLTDVQLDEIEARSKAATPGPWGVEAHRVTALAVRDVDTGSGVKVVAQTPRLNADVAFIAHARADVPALVAALRESRERERRYEMLLSAAREWCLYMSDADTNENGSHEDEERMMTTLTAAVDSCEARAALGEQEAT